MVGPLILILAAAAATAAPKVPPPAPLRLTARDIVEAQLNAPPPAAATGAPAASLSGDEAARVYQAYVANLGRALPGAAQGGMQAGAGSGAAR